LFGPIDPDFSLSTPSQDRGTAGAELFKLSPPDIFGQILNATEE
jgi:hypothetical protein